MSKRLMAWSREGENDDYQHIKWALGPYASREGLFVASYCIVKLSTICQSVPFHSVPDGCLIA